MIASALCSGGLYTVLILVCGMWLLYGYMTPNLALLPHGATAKTLVPSGHVNSYKIEQQEILREGG